MKKSFFRLSVIGLMIVALASCKKEPETTKITIEVANAAEASAVIDEGEFCFVKEEIYTPITKAPLKDGKFEFNLPLTVDESMLMPITAITEGLPNSGITFSNESAKAGLVDVRLYKDGTLSPNYILAGMAMLSDQEAVGAGIMYVNGDCDITGTSVETESGYEITYNLDLKLKKGYNFFYLKMNFETLTFDYTTTAYPGVEWNILNLRQ